MTEEYRTILLKRLSKGIEMLSDSGPEWDVHPHYVYELVLTTAEAVKALLLESRYQDSCK